jgi:hypothetical protein
MTFKEVLDEFRHKQRNTEFFIYKNGGNKAAKITQFKKLFTLMNILSQLLNLESIANRTHLLYAI